MSAVAIQLAPIVGEDRVVGSSKCRWVVCPICGGERWVRLEKGVLRSKVCRRCCSEDTRNRMSQSALGHPCSQETRDRISKVNMGHIGYMLGRHHTEETKHKLCLAHKGKVLSPVTKEKLRLANLGKIIPYEIRQKIKATSLGRVVSPSTRLKMSKAQVGKTVSQETRAKISASLTGLKISDVTREKLSQQRLGHIVTQETRAKISTSLMGHEFSEETRARWLVAMQKRLHMKPNKVEIKLLSLLNKLYPNEWKFVGDWSLVIDGKNPDFVNIDGKKLIIELFGDYWHKGQEPEKRVDLFGKFGYRTLVVWEHELNNIEELKSRMRVFVG